MSHPIPDTPETRAALALPTAEAAAALGIHPGSVRRLRKRMSIAAPASPKGRPLVVRVPAELREALEREAARRNVPMADVARKWMVLGGRATAARSPASPPPSTGER